MRAELWLIPITDAPRTPGERMLAGEPWVVLHEIAVQHILRKFPGPAKGFNPVKVGDGFDFRRHRAGGLLVPEYDVADEIRCRKRRRRQTKKFMAGLDPARMADLFGGDFVVHLQKRN